MRVFLAGTSFDPSYGGPATSVASLARELAIAGIDVGVWAPDQSVHCLTSLEQYGIRCLRGTLRRASLDYGVTDIFHDNGIWRSHNHALSRQATELGVPRIVSTRGMLEPWSFHHKALKKRLAWSLYQMRDLQRATCLHATAKQEAVNLCRLGLGVPIITIPNGVDIPADAELQRYRTSIVGNKRKVALFLSRLNPVKGLRMLIEAWARIRPPGWTLNIAGPDERGHRAEIERLVLLNGLADDITFLGTIAPEKRGYVYATANLFILPTHSENFGMVVAEALAHGLPVLTTTGAPWAQLIAQRCGWWVAPTTETIAGALREATSCDVSTLREMGGRGREYVRVDYSWPVVARAMLDVYKSMTSPGSSAILL